MPVTYPYLKPAQSSPYPQIPLPADPSILILSSYLRLGLPSGLFPTSFSNKHDVYPSPLPHTRYMPRPSLSFRFYHPNNIGWGVQIIKLLIMWFHSLPCYRVPLRPKYSLHRPILKDLQPSFLPQCEEPSSIPIQSIRQSYISVYTRINLLYFHSISRKLILRGEEHKHENFLFQQLNMGKLLNIAFNSWETDRSWKT